MVIYNKILTFRYVLGPDLGACARDLYHRYHNCKDADSYLAGETLFDVVLVPLDATAILAVLACGDRAVRFYNILFLVVFFSNVKIHRFDNFFLIRYVYFPVPRVQRFYVCQAFQRYSHCTGLILMIYKLSKISLT